MSYCRDTWCRCHTTEQWKVRTPFPAQYGTVSAMEVIYCCPRCACLGVRPDSAGALR